MAFQKMIKALLGFIEFKKIKNPGLVIYLEGSHDLPHILPIVSELKKEGEKPIIVSSEILETKEDYIYIGSGFFRILFFTVLNCDCILMTMPDLNRLHVKRSTYPVKYAYVFHSLSSSHTIYHEEAFDAYDTIYAAGPHHMAEIKKREEILGLPNKEVIEAGYPRVDSLLKGEECFEKRDKITIAPTWGESSIIENESGFKVIREIISLGYKTYLRVHPMTVRHHPSIISKLEKMSSESSNFFIEKNMGNQSNLEESFLMISDWSGASFEFSLTQSRPVLFIDTPQKINNENWNILKLPAAEKEVRGKFGKILKHENLSDLKRIVDEFYENQQGWHQKIKEESNNYVFNLGSGAKVIAKDLKRRIAS